MKTWLFLLVVLVASVAKAQQERPRDFAAEEKATLLWNRACEFPNLKLPADYLVYAAGAYSGRPVGFQIDQSGHEATQIDVEVNNPAKPVVLMLGAYEPTIWNISWSERTQILAVLASGYHRQVITGLAKQTPTLISTYDNRGSCGYFYISSDNLGALNPQARRTFGRAVDMVYLATNGKVVVGTPMPPGAKLVTSRDTTPQSFRDPTAPTAGPAGLEEAVREGLLRKATPADAEAWSNAVAQNSPNRDIPPIAGQGIPKPPPPPIYNAYVVLKPFTYPSGLYGGNSATFLIPKGVAKPTGNPGHSRVYDFNSLNCYGALCGTAGPTSSTGREFSSHSPSPAPTPSEKDDFSPANDQGLAPLRSCYTRHMLQIDDGKMSDREIARSAMKACPKETKAVSAEALTWGARTKEEADATIEYWAIGVLRWLRANKQRAK